jgi:hypothetical protein
MIWTYFSAAVQSTAHQKCSWHILKVFVPMLLRQYFSYSHQYLLAKNFQAALMPNTKLETVAVNTSGMI